MKAHRLSLAGQRARVGYVFLIPWSLGALLFFIDPLLKTIQYSFTDFQMNGTGGFVLTPLEDGLFAHYRYAFTADPDFLQYFAGSLRDMAYQVPVILVFSLFISIVLNQRFRGRGFMRAMFFLPVIITTGLITVILKTDLTEVARGGSSAESNLFNSAMLAELLRDSGLSDGLVNAVSGAVNNIVDLVWQSGIQILIFMTGLLSISPSHYEVASIEGASAWDAFWKITFPMILPYLLVNAVYTIIDNFTSYANKTMRYIVDVGYKSVRFSYSAAIAWIYFLSVMLILGLLFGIFSRFTTSEAKK